MKNFILIEMAKAMKEHKLRHMWRYAAMMALLLTLACGQMWADTELTFSPTAQSLLNSGVRVVSANSVPSQLKIANVEKTNSWKIDSNPIRISSTSANITKIEFIGCTNSSSTSGSEVCGDIQVSTDSSSFSTITSGVTIKDVDGVDQTTGVGFSMVKNGVSPATTVTVTFSSNQRYIHICKAASNGKQMNIASIKVYTAGAVSTKRIYMEAANGWNNSTPYFYAKSWGVTGSTVLMTQVSSCETNVFYADIPSGDNNILFTRQSTNSGIKYKDETGNYNQSVDINCSSNDKFTFNGDWNKNSSGKSDFNYGTYSAPAYTVTYNKNGDGAGGAGSVTGSVPTDSNSPYDCHDDVTVLGNTGSLERTGYDFAGWRTAAGSGDTYVAGDTYEDISANTTFYAKWTPQEYLITLDNESATTAGASSVTATYDAAMPSIAANLPAKTGYVFQGYFTEKEGSGTKYINADGSSAENSDFTSATTLYAAWKVATPTILCSNNTDNEVTISCTTEGAAIYYTTNGTTPTSSSKLYTGKFTIKSTKTVKAIAIIDGAIDSDVASQSCTYNAPQRVFKSGEKIYFKDADNNITWGDINTLWVVNTNNVYAYFFDETTNNWASGAGTVVKHSHSYGNAIYEFTVPQTTAGVDHEWTHVIFTRGSAASWDGCDKQTTDQRPNVGQNMFTISKTSGDYNKDRTPTHKWNGSWSTYAKNPALLGDFNDWTPDYGTFSAGRVILDLDEDYFYEFKVLVEETWWGCTECSSITNTNTPWALLYSGQSNYSLITQEAGEYCFHWDNTNHYLGIYYPQARLKKGEYIYFDARNSDTDHWRNAAFHAKYVYKYYDSDSQVGSDVFSESPVESWVHYTTVPNDDYVGQVQVNRNNPSAHGTEWNHSNSRKAADRTSTKENCLAIAEGEANYDVPTPIWKTYCPPMSSSGLVDNGTVKTWGGAGTEESPYLIPTESTIKLIASSTSAVPGDDNMTAYYQFKDDDDEIRAGSETTTYDYTASSTNATTHIITSEAYNYYNSTSGTHLASSAIYYETRTPYTINYKKGANGTGDESSVTKLYGVNITLLGETFTRTGYTQTGWAIEDGGSKEYELEADCSDNEDLDLYPYWECTTPTFDTDLSTSTVNVNQHASASALTVEASSSTGGTITYQWYKNTANSTTTPEPSPISGATSASYTPSTETAGTTYYFCEAKNTTGGNCTTNSSITPVSVTPTYRVTYNANLVGASGSTAASSYYVTETPVTTSACGFNKSGYKFKWWNTASNGSGEDFYVTEKVTLDDDDVELFAQWESVDSDEEFWVGSPSEWHAETHDVSVGDMNIKPQDYSSNNNMINTHVSSGSNKEYTEVNATDKHAIVMAIGADNKYIEISFTDGSTINELDLGVAAKDGTNPKMAVLYSTNADFSTGEYYFAEVEVPTIAQTSKQVTSANPDVSNKYMYVRIYSKISTAVYSETGGSGKKLRIYSIKAKKGTACTSPTIGSQPSNVSICSGSTTTLTVSSITGGTTPYSYQWYDASDDSEVSSGSGYNTASFTTPELDDAASYYCIVTEAGGCTTQSNTAAVSMKTDVSITTQPSDVDDAVVGSASTLTIVAAGTSPTYQWYTCDDDKKTNAAAISSGSNASAITDELSITPASVGVTYYYCVVDGCGGPLTSDVVSITAKNALSLSLSYASSVTYGSTISPTLTGNSGSGTTTYTLNSVDPANSLSINSSTGVVTGEAAGGSATVTVTVGETTNYWGGSATSSSISVTKAALSVTATAGTATSITHNAATLPFTLSSTTGVVSVTLKVYLNSDNSLVKTVSGVTAATSGSGEVTGLSNSTTYYFTVTPIGDANHNDGAASSKSSTFTTEAAPTLSALVSGTGYTPADMLPTGTTISTSSTYAEGLSDNTKFFIVGDADNEGNDGGVPEIKTKTGDRIIVNETNYDDHCYFKKGAAKSGQIPTSHAIKFILPTSGNLYVIGNGSKINLVKDDAESPTTLSFTSNEATVTGLAAGTYYMYATGTSQRIEYLKFTTIYAVTLHDNNGGDHNGSADVAVNGTTLLNISAPTRSGYGVSGYYAESDYTTLVADAEGNLEKNVTVSATNWTDSNGKWIKGSGATLYAKWGAVYTVTFNTNGGSSVASLTQTSVGASITMPAAPTKTGYTFNGWQIGSTYAVGASYTPTANVTAYATWNESCDASSIFNFTVNNSGDDLTVARNGGSLSLTTSNAFSTLTGGTVTVVNTNTNSGGPDKMVGSDNSERHVRFTSTNAYLTLALSSDLAQGDVIEFTGNGSAQICITTSTTYSSSIGTTTNKLIISESSPLIDVSTIYIWPVSTSTKIKTLSISRPTICYHVTYNGNGATSGYVNDDDAYAEDADPTIASNGYTKTGYTFRCWNTAADRSGTDYEEGATYTDIKADVTLYAIWVKDEHVGKYTFHYGTSTTGDADDFSGDWTVVPFPAEPARSRVTDLFSDYDYAIENFTMPDPSDYPHFWVGYEGWPKAQLGERSGSGSKVHEWDDVIGSSGYFKTLPGSMKISDGTNTAVGAKGTLEIHKSTSAESENLSPGLIPSGYGLTIRDDSEDVTQTLVFHKTNNPDIWETDILASGLTSDEVAGTFKVSLATGTEGVYTDCYQSVWADKDDLDANKDECDQYNYGKQNYPNITAGKKGRFQIVNNFQHEYGGSTYNQNKNNFALRYVTMDNWTLRSGAWGGEFISDVEKKWSLGHEPTIDEDVIMYHSTSIGGQTNAQAKSIKIDKSDPADDMAWAIRLTIDDYYGALLVAEDITVKHQGDANFGPTTKEDLQIESEMFSNGVLITGKKSTNTQATYEFYTKAYKAGSYGYINQFIGIPFEQINAYQYYSSYLYEYEPNDDKWVTCYSTMYGFKAYNLLRASQTGRTSYYLDGTLNLPGIKAGDREKVLTCTSDRYADASVWNGEHMFANSWTAPIEIGAMDSTDFDGVDPTIYIFNAGSVKGVTDTTGYGKELGNNPGQWTALPIADVRANPGNYPYKVIPGTQAFLVRATAEHGTVTLDYKKHVYDPALAGVDITPTRAPKRNTDYLSTRLKMIVVGEGIYKDETQIHERADFSFGHDAGWDGYKINGNAHSPQLYTVSNAKQMSVNAIPDMEGTVVGFRKGSDDDIYTFSFIYDGEEEYYLNDLKEQTSTLISNENTYMFSAEAGDAEARFIISTTPIQNVPTGVEQTNGEADTKVRKVLINDHIYIIRGGQMYSVDGALVK